VALMEKGSEGPWYYEQLDLGLNYRMTDLQAALGSSQLRRLDEFVARRRELAGRYDRLLAELPVILPWQHPDTASAWHLYVVQLDPARCARSRRDVFDALRAAGIGVNVHYIPVHRQPYYRALGAARDACPEADTYYERAITLPLFYGLTEADQDRVIAALGNVLQ
jgi:dTDP-4-amino-4,6-dideoxygalactose transaminase